jgi:hypothetical protein
MTQDQNYYVIVGRDGNRPVTRWSPTRIDVATARNGDSCDRRTALGSYSEIGVERSELIHDTAS